LGRGKVITAAGAGEKLDAVVNFGNLNGGGS